MLKTYSLFLALIVCSIGCKKEPTFTVTRTCNSSSDYAKTRPKASQKLIGNWHLTRIVGGFIANPRPIPTAEVMLRFTAVNQLVITVDGDQKPPVSYDVIFGPFPYDPANSGVQLTVANYVTYPGNPGFSLGNSTMYVCDEQLVLDYGTVVDGPAQVYNRVP